MSKRLGFAQRYTYSMYIDCKKRSKKDTSDFNNPDDRFKADEKLIEFMVKNSSITDGDPESDRCFHNVNKAITTICKQLCPGEWCTRGHCRHNGSGYAYNCSKGTRPAICKDFKKWREGQAKREAKKGGNNE